MDAKVKEPSLEEPKAVIDEAVDMRLEERPGDPDAGLGVKADIIKRIRNS